MPAGSGALAGRYGDTANRRKLNRWLLIGLGVFIALVMVLWAVWGSGLGGATGSLDFTATASDAIDAQHIVVSFDVDAPAHAAVSCAVEAQNIDFTVVGYDVVHIPASAATHHHLTQTLVTYEKAVSGSLDKCWLS